ncbi:hypothetical protein APHAL10511_001325 [Amanita phalloides]|nr:hypothetical protein APHAL10511_001325 [Amanita phalloides]
MKRKASTNCENLSATTSEKKVKTQSGEQSDWPEYFHSLFQVFKALNTVLAFVSSKNHLATTFAVIRTSAEGLLKRPLLLSDVAELKALIPDTVKFSYVSRNEIQIHENSIKATQKPQDAVDFSLPSSSQLEDEHILVLEFTDNLKGKKSANIGQVTLSDTLILRLIENRNKKFQKAVNDLILATSPDDAVEVVKKCGQDHIPINPNIDSSGKSKLSVLGFEERPSVASIVEQLFSQEWYKGQIIHRRFIEGKPGQTARITPPLPEAVVEALKSRNIDKLYTHQVAAIQSFNQGKNVVVSTSTASGKSIIYQVPVLSSLLVNPASKAIFVYPTKALAQDQQASLRLLLKRCPGLETVSISTYDGDTPQEVRASIRESSTVIFTNFDMLHASILPHEELWRGFFRNMKLFVIDELHYYSGSMASHVAQVLRRFRRLAKAIGNHEIQFVSCSATISDPLVHMKRLTGIVEEDIHVITEDGAPAGPKEHLIWNTELGDSKTPLSSLSEAIRLMIFLMKHGFRVILFCKIRKVCELVMKSLKADLSSEGRFDILERVKPYRGGYSQEDRRRIEQDAFGGCLLGIVATNALELGVDIGVLDVVIMLGFPMSIASFRQQAGRVGRRSRDSLTIFVAENFAIDRYYVNKPDELYDQAPDDLLVDIDNRFILEAHLQCAAHEMPLSLDDAQFFGPQLQEICQTKLIKDEDGWYHPHPSCLPYPSRHITIRGVQEEKYTVVEVKREDKVEILEEIEESRAMFEVYEGGVFLHQGVTYVVQEVNHDTRMVQVIQADVNWITSPRDFTDIDAIQTYRIREITHSSYRVYYGKIKVHVKVFGFFKIRNKRILDTVDLDTPVWERETMGFWIDLPRVILDVMRDKNIDMAGAIHAAEHALLNRFSLSEDVRTECKASEKEYRVTESRRKRPARLIFFDAIGKGVRDLLEKADAAIQHCCCSQGCKQCVQSPMCKENNEVCSKLGAMLIIRTLLGREIDPLQIPEQDEIYGLDTIVAATTVRSVGVIEVENAL